MGFAGPDDSELQTLARQLGERAVASGVQVCVAESCTGGWLAKVITDLPGCSAWFERGFVTYTNQAKQELLGVEVASLAALGAVSETVVGQMAAGALRHSPAQLSAAISGIAGPGGATPDKPLGTVCFGWGCRDRPVRVTTRHFAGDREAVRRQSVACALQGLLERLS